MLLDETADSLDLARLGADCVWALQQANPSIQLQSVVARVVTGITHCQATPSDATNLGWGFVKAQGHLVVVIQGVERPGHASNYVEALNEEINFNLDGGCNTYLISQAERIRFALLNLGVLRTARIVVFGHSMGGAVACDLAHTFRYQGDAPSISVITYGAPRPGPDSFAALIQPIDLVRWMTSLDSVPLIPPRQNQAPSWFAVAPQVARLNANRYVHPSGGIVVHLDGTAADRDVPEIAFEDIQASISIWLYTCYLGVNSIHSIPAYIIALRERAALPSQQRPKIDGSGSPETPVERNHSGVIDRAVKQHLNTIRAQAVAQDAVPLRIPEQWIVRATKVAGTWGVYWNGVLIAIGPQKGRCRRIAHSLNLALRRLQQFGFVGADDLATTFQQYLEAAKTNGSGFEPTMRSD